MDENMAAVPLFWLKHLQLVRECLITAIASDATCSVSQPSKFQYYQSDVKRVKKAGQHRRQDRQLRDFVSVREERRGTPR